MNEARYRAAEQALFAHYDIAPVEKVVRLADAGTSLRVWEVGEGEPVVFIHGANNAGATWAPLVPHLERMRAILVDRPGNGLSEPLPTRFDQAGFDAFADGFVAQVLDALSLERAHVVSTSMGSYFTVRSAAAQPERMKTLTCVAWSFGARMHKVPRAMRFATVPGGDQLMTRMPMPMPAIKMMLRQLGMGDALATGKIGPEFLAWFQSLLRDTGTLRNEIRTLPPLITPIRGQNEAVVLGDDVLAAVKVPTLFLWGTDDPVGGADDARAYSARIPGARLELFEGAGHAPWIDDPEGIAREINAFVGT